MKLLKYKNHIKFMLNKWPWIIDFTCFIYNYLPFNNTFKIDNTNKIKFKDSLLKKCKINIIGKNNVINIANKSKLYNCYIFIYGNNNIIQIGERGTLHFVEFWIEDDCNKISIGKSTGFAGKTHFACIEGRQIRIGEDSMFSGNVVLRTGDSHSIVDSNGKRINYSKDITVGKHVWVGNSVTLLKGASIASNSIIGSGAIVTSKFEQPGVIIAGNPAKIIKNGINWERERR